MKTLRITATALGLIAALALAVAPVPPAQAMPNDCFLLRDSGVMCDTECSGSLGCFDEDTGTCCWDSLNACGMESGCEVCDGAQGCTLGDF